MELHIAIIILSLLLIWFCSGRILDEVSVLAQRLRVPKFSFSLLLLGLLTSIPEASVALNSVMIGKPEISLGNLIGGQVILLLVIIPLLAYALRGLHFRYPLQPRTIALTLMTNAIPFLALMNSHAHRVEGMVMLGIYWLFTAVFAVDMESEHKILIRQRIREKNLNRGATSSLLLRVLVYVGLIFLASNKLVGEVVFLAEKLALHSFFISLFVVSIGTNIPEIVLAIRSVLGNKSTIALGDYIGSATANTLIAGIVILVSGGAQVMTPTAPLLIPLIGFLLFWFFARSKRTLSALEATVLIFVSFSFFLASAWLEMK